MYNVVRMKHQEEVGKVSGTKYCLQVGWSGGIILAIVCRMRWNQAQENILGREEVWKELSLPGTQSIQDQ
jgi:hypothetical protein